MMTDGIAASGFTLWTHRLGNAALTAVAGLFDAMADTQPGIRIDPRTLRDMPALTPVQEVAAQIIGADARPVRALLFDKHDGANWALGWHQDRTIEVSRRIEIEGFGPFTSKQGRLHVAPPIAVVERMLTVRVHLDPVDDDNGPLIVAPGSHCEGYIAETQIARVVDRCGAFACHAEAGQVWFYATPILRRSGRSVPGRRRRVVQIDYAHDPLPGGLRWSADD